MDSFELNKIAGAVLGTLLVIFGVGAIGDIIFEAEEPETPAYVIAVAETPAEGAGESGGPAEQPIAVLLANADPAAGEASARKCASCHTFEEGGANRVGPNLYNVVERPIASVQGFSYSDALQAHAQEAGNWTFDELSAFIASPRQAVPGTTMGFAGIQNAEERADLLAYLRSLSPNPVPLPEAPAGAAATAEAEPGEVPEEAEPPMPAAETAELEPESPQLPRGEGVTLDREAGLEGTTEQPGQPQQQGQAQQGQAQQRPAQQGQPQQAPAQQGQAEQGQAQQGQGQDTLVVVPPADEAGAQQGQGPQAQQQTQTGQAQQQGQAGQAQQQAQPGQAQQQDQAQQPSQQAQAGQAQQQGQQGQQTTADVPPAVALMSEVDVAAGEAEARKCQACHALEEGGGNRVGPPLWGVVNRPIASVDGYAFSQALADFGQAKQWDFALLDAFIQAPQTLVPGTKMAFPGIKNERDRAELLVYLNSLSDQPAPLPGGGGQGAPAQPQ